MSKMKVKMKRSVVVALTLALVWMFMLPMQAFAEESGDTGSGIIGNQESQPAPEGGQNDQPPAGGGQNDQPPADGGQNDQPPADGGQNDQPPADGGQNDQPPADGGQDPQPDGGQDPQPEEQTAVPTKMMATAPSSQTETEITPPTQKEEDSKNKSGAYVNSSGEWVRFENGENGNAIQQAVDAAIAAGKDYITVVVQDGTYTGGLNIDNSGKNSIVVNIIAHDAYKHQQEESGTASGTQPAATEGNGGTTTGTTTTETTTPAPNAVYPVPINPDGKVNINDTNADGTQNPYAVNTGSAGGVKLEGGVSVNNVELLLAGIYLTLKEQKDNQGKLESLLTDKGNVDVKVENADNFTYYGTAQGDSANITLTDVGNAVIKTGDGDDVIDVNTTTSANVELTYNNETGTLQGNFAGADSANSNIQISSGDGNDKITVTESNKITYKETAQTNGTTVTTVSVRKGVNNLTVHAGEGADTITLKGSSNLVDLKYDDFPDAIANEIYRILSANINVGGTNPMVHGSTAVIDGGAGDDQLNLDTSWEQGTFGETKVDYRGGEGKNRLHLTGALNDTRNDAVSGEWKDDGSGAINMYSKHTISRTDYKVIHTDLWLNKKETSLDILSSRILAVTMSGVYSLTDDLAGKKTVDVTISSDGKIMEAYQTEESGQSVTKTREVVFQPFTDYVFMLAEGQKVPGFSNTSASGLLTKLIIRGQNINVAAGTRINIPGATLMLESVTGSEGGSIRVDGFLTADNIMLKVVSSDAGGVSHLEPEGDSPSIFDINTSASVTIGQNASLTATRVVDILAKSIHSNGLLPDLTSLIPGFDSLLENEKTVKINEYMKKLFGVDNLEKIQQAASINFVSIKFAYAVVEILGDIIAGAVKVMASNKMETDATNTALRDLGLPFALSMITAETGIRVYDGSHITADNGDISMDAQSDIKTNTSALSGRLPFTVAVSVVDNQVYVDIQGGALKSTNGNIIANATGIVNMSTNASGSNVRPNNNAVGVGGSDQPIDDSTNVEMGKSGGFFAISVLTQDVFSALHGSAAAIAKGDISITSTAKASVVNKAASNPEEDGEAMTLVDMIRTLAGVKKTDGNSQSGDSGIVGTVRDKVDGFLKGKSNQLNSQEENEKIEKDKIDKQNAKKNTAFSKFLDKLTGTESDDDVGSLVDKATSSANPDNTNTMQLVGALGITYASNDNRAYIDTTGEVSAEGAVSVVANGEMNVETLADGSPVKADDPAGGDKKGPQDQHYAEHKHGKVKVDKLTNGTIIIDASVGEDDVVDGNTIYKVVENKGSFWGIGVGDTFSFVVKASSGYKLKADEEDGKYYITTEYTDPDDEEKKKTDKIEVQLVGKDSEGCYLYRVVGTGYKVIRDENLFKAEFVPKQKINVVNGEEEDFASLGSVEITNAKEDGKPLYYADQGEDVYVKINVKSGVSFIAPYITYLVKGSETAQPVTFTKVEGMGGEQKDGTVDYYYTFKMPESDVTIDIRLKGNAMNIGLDSGIPGNSSVWITPASENPSGDAMAADAVYAGRVGDKVKVVIQLAEGTFIKNKSMKLLAGDKPYYIKGITYDGNGQYTCLVDIPAIIQNQSSSQNPGSTPAVNALKLFFETTTNEAEAQGTVKKTSTALGAGLAVDVTRYNNQAYITKVKDNTLAAGSVTVQANTSQLGASATSKAGFVAGDLGVAGAITVHLVSANNEALIGGNITALKLAGGNLTVESNIQNSAIVTNAEAAGDGASGDSVASDSVGVGAGIAVGITNLAVVSRILDTVTIGAATENGTIGNVTINAGHTGSESMTATAGASGGTSVVPVLALNISGVSVLADSGKLVDNVLNLTGDALVKAANSMTRDITADAAAVGGGVGVGASFIIDILNDSANAKLGRSVKAGGNVTVSAESVSRLKATAKSGAQGSVSENADAQAAPETTANNPDDADPLPAGTNNTTSTTNATQTNNLTGNTDYYEGLDDLFGEGSTDNALDEDDDAESLAPLFREGEADAFVDSNQASATALSGMVANNNGNVNATNTQNAFQNRQKAETSEGSVQVAATMVLNIQNNTALAQIDTVNFVEAGEKISVTSRHDTDGVIMANASATKSTTGVGVAVAINTVSYSNVAQILTGSIKAAEVIVRADVYEADTKKTADDFFTSIQNDLLSSYESIKKFIEGAIAASEKGEQDPNKDYLADYITNFLGEKANTISKEVKSGIAQLLIQWVGELLQGKTLSFPTAEQEDKIKEEAIKYGKAIFEKLKENFSPKKLKNLIFGKKGLLTNLKNSIKDINLKEQATKALVNYLSGKLGGNEEPEAVGPRISTSAVSGAGATNVGVAGSVAISVVKGTSGAYIADFNGGKMEVSGNITVESKASQDVYTSAGASVDALGNVDKNKNATDSANNSQNGSSNADAGKSVGVGAAVALSFADLTSNAGIGSGWTVTAKDLVMNSTAVNNVETTSVSGTDPLGRSEDPTDKKEEEDKEKTEEEKKAEEEKKKAEEEAKAAKAMDYAVDASVSVTLIQNSVKSYLAENSVITLTGNLNMLSSQAGETNTNASGFAMGRATAVGAAVAINLAFSDVLTQVLGSGTVAGSASVDAKTENQDDTNAVALAMGAEMERYVAKLRNSEKVMAFNKKKEEENKKDEKIETNDTSKKVSDQLNRASKVSGVDAKDNKSDASQPLSVQAIKSQNVKTENANQTDSNANNNVGQTVTNATDNKTGNAVTGTLNGQTQSGQTPEGQASQSIHVAASVGVNVTAHEAKVQIKNNLTVGGLKANVENSSNFTTASTGAAISEAANSNCVGAAVAVSVNGNKAVIDIDDGVSIIVTGTPAAATEENNQQKQDPLIGNVALTTVLNQNSTGEALGRYGVLAIAGSSSGKGGKVGLAGSVAVLVAKGTSAIVLGDGVTITGDTDKDGIADAVAGDVKIEASDKSKLSAAALAATKSDGVAVGAGASFALLYAKNQVLAEAGEDFTVSAGSFSMRATKHAVSFDDFEPDISVEEFISVLVVDENGDGGYKKEDAHKYGMYVLQKNQDGSYNFFKNLETEDILHLIQLTSVLASVNYYASAVAGTVMESKGDTSGQKAAVAGAVSMLFNDSVTRASMGDGAKITTTGAAEIKASSETNTRLLGGALSASGAKTGIGLNVATVKQNDTVQALVGDGAVIRAGNLLVQAHCAADLLVITAAAVSSDGTSVGGALNVVINNTGAKAQVGTAAQITTTGTQLQNGETKYTMGSVEILADSQSKVILGSVNLSISGSENQGAAAGGVVTVSTNASAAEAELKGGTVNSFEAITIDANNQELVINVLAAASRSGNGAAGAGTVSVLTTDAKALAKVGDGAALTALKDITIKAASQAKLIGVMAAAAASTDAPAVGATIMVNVFNRESGASVGINSVLISKLGNVLVQADSDESAILISVAGAAASDTAISGNIQVNVGNSHTYATIGNGATIKAWNSIGVTANQKSFVVTVSPTITLAPGSNAVGATVQTNILKGKAEALIGDNATLIAYAQDSSNGGVQTSNREDKRKGIILSALSKDTVIAVSLSVSGGSNALAGTVETMVNEIRVQAKIGANSTATVGFTNGDAIDDAFDAGMPSDQEGDLTAESDAHSTIMIFGGAMSATSSNGVGATVLTLVDNKTVDAQILLSNQKPSKVNGAINVTANAEDHLTVVSVNFGVSNNSAVNVGGNVLIFQSAVNAALSGNVTAAGNVTIQADNYTRLINAIGAASGSLANAAVSGAALVTYFKGHTTASVGAGSQLTCKDLKVHATSTADIDSDGVGITASVGGAAVSGLVNVIVTSTHTEAFIGSGCRIQAANIEIIATDNFDLLAIAVSLSGGSNGVGVTAVVTVAKNTVKAYIADNDTLAEQADIVCSGLTVKAISNRNIGNYAGSVAAGSSAGAGVTVMVAVIGGKLDQDSANGLAQGFDPAKFLGEEKQAYMPNAARDYLVKENADDNNYIDLSSDLAADSNKASDLEVGNEKGQYTGTDGYRSDDFDASYTPGTNPGENFSDTTTNTEGSNLGMAKPTDDSKNVIQAYIGNNHRISVNRGDVFVDASENLNVDIVTASASVGGTAGVNVGVAVLVAYSNVLAEIRSGSVVNATNITVNAASGGDGTTFAPGNASEVLKAAKIDASTQGSSIRVIAITIGGGGSAGISPSVAVLTMATKTIARMDGVQGSGNIVKVNAKTNYPNVLAVTGAIGFGGEVGLSASVAVVTFHSETEASIKNSKLSVNGLDIQSTVNNTAKAYAVSIAGGAVGINGAVAVVTNNSITKTLLGSGEYRVYGNVTVSTVANTSAESFIVGLSLGGAAVGLNAAVVNQHAKITTKIYGSTEDANSGNTASSNTAILLYATRDVTVSNSITATAKSSVYAASAGAVGVGGNVLLVFNNMEAIASIYNMPFTVAGNVTVNAAMKADSEANLTSATLGATAVGLSTSYVGLNVQNKAYLELAEGMTGSALNIRVWAGSGSDVNSFHATASTVAAGIAGVSVGLNAAIADINASNEAKILSNGTLSGGLSVQAKSLGRALAEVYFASVGAVAVYSATAVSVLRLRQSAEVEIATINNCYAFFVNAVLNETFANPCYAKLVTISGGMYIANANVAVAYSLSQNIAKAVVGNGTIGTTIDVSATGWADAKSETLNQTTSAYSGTVSVNVAYAKSQFQSILRILNNVRASNAKVQTIYTTNAEANLTPSAMGASISLGDFTVNLAIAKAAATALASVEGSGKLVLTYDLQVKADSSKSKALANIEGATVSIKGFQFAVNVADSQLALEQTVEVKDITVEAGRDIFLYSYADSLASVAQTGSNGGVGVTLVGGTENLASADVSAVNKILLNQAFLTAVGNALTQASSKNLSVSAMAKALTFQLSGISAAITITEAKVTRFKTGVFMDGGSITGGNVQVLSGAKGSNVVAQSSVPRFSGSLIGSTSVLATAKILEKLTQVVVSSGLIRSTVADVILKAESDARMKADSARPSSSAGVLSVEDYQFRIQVNKILTEVLFQAQLDSARDAQLTAYDSITGDIVMDSNTIGLYAGHTGVANIHVANQTAHVKAAGQITAVRDILIQAKADQKLTAIADLDNTNFTGRGYAKTEITVYRNAIVDIAGSLISTKGNIAAYAQLGTRDTNNKVIYLDLDVAVDTWVDLEDYPRGTGKLVSNAKLNVAEGSLIQALRVTGGDKFGNVTLQAKSEGVVLVEVYRYVDKFAGGNRAYSVADVSETVQVNIGNKEKTQILGRNVSILALSEMDVRSVAHGRGNTVFGFFYPNATVIFCVDLDTVIRSAEVSAQNLLNIGAYLPYTYVLGHCISVKDWGSSYNSPSVTVKGHIYGDVSMDSNSTIQAAEYKLKAFEPADANNQVKIERLAESFWGSSKTSTDEHKVFDTTDRQTINKFNTSAWADYCKDLKFVPGVYNPNIEDENYVYYSGKVTTSIYVEITESGVVNILGIKQDVSPDTVVTKNGDIYYLDGAKLLDSVLTNNGVVSNGNLNIVNKSQYALELINVNKSGNDIASHLNVTQTNANANLIFNGSGNFANGSIHVELAGGNLELKEGSQINAQHIFISGVGTIVDRGRTDGKLVISNCAPSSNSSDSSIYLEAKAALDLLLQTINSNYHIDRIQTEGALTLEVANTANRTMDVVLGMLISGGNVSVTVPHNLESADPDKVNITGDGIVIEAGGKVGTADQHLRIDSSVKNVSCVSVNATGGIYLKEAEGDLYIKEIDNNVSGDISIWTENGSIYSGSDDLDGLENVNKHMMEYLNQSDLVTATEDLIWILIQYMSDMLDLQDALELSGDDVLEEVKQEIDILHGAISVEHALEILQENLLMVGGTLFEDPEVAAALMNGALDNKKNLTASFLEKMEKLNPKKDGGILGFWMVEWSDYYQQMQKNYDKMLKSAQDLQNDTINIFGAGNVQLHVQSASGEANVGHEHSSLNIFVPGKLTISAAEDTVLKNVYLECFDKLTLDPIHATGVIDLYTMYGIFAANKSNQVLLNADSMVIWSLDGDLGTSDQALILNTNKLEALGNFVALENRKDLAVNLIIATNVLNLTVKGDLSAMPEEETDLVNGLYGMAINLQVSGNVGAQDAELNISAEEYLNITAKNLYMICDGDVMVGTIRADGMVSIYAYKGSIQNAGQGSGIWCNAMRLNSYGMIGTEESPLVIHSNSVFISSGGGMQRRLFRAVPVSNTGLTANSELYGENLHIIPVPKETAAAPDNAGYEPITVTSNGVRITGSMGEKNVLKVSYVSDHAACPICQVLMENHQVDGRVCVHLELEGECFGMLKIEIPVSEELAAYEGQEIVVLLCHDGKVWAIRAKVINGFVTFHTDEVGAFLIPGDPAQLELTEEETHIILDDELLPFGGWL